MKHDTNPHGWGQIHAAISALASGYNTASECARFSVPAGSDDQVEITRAMLCAAEAMHALQEVIK